MAMDWSRDALRSCLKQAVKKFQDHFRTDETPCVSVYAPGRVNLIGEHTDYNEGFVLPMALNLVTVIVGRPSDTAACRILTCCDVDESNVVEMAVPGCPSPDERRAEESQVLAGVPKWAHYVLGVVALMNESGNVPGFDAVVASCVPLGGGLSSSASLEVATYLFIQELCRMRKIVLPICGKTQQAALVCQKAEHMYAQAPCGIMDQFVCMMAKADHAFFIDCRPTQECVYNTEDVPFEVVSKGLVVMVTNSNVKHSIACGPEGKSSYAMRKDNCEEAAGKLGKRSLREASGQDLDAMAAALDVSLYPGKSPTQLLCARHVVYEIQRTREAVAILRDGGADTYRRFGELMNASHVSLRDDYRVSCEELDYLVEQALGSPRDQRVYGSRMTGGGFGGCTVTLLETEAVDDVQTRIQAGYQNRFGKTATFFLVSACSAGGVIAKLQEFL